MLSDMTGLKRSAMNDGRETDNEMEKLTRLTGIYVSYLPMHDADILFSFSTTLGKDPAS